MNNVAVVSDGDQLTFPLEGLRRELMSLAPFFQSRAVAGVEKDKL